MSEDKTKASRILAIETSCDETAAAVVDNGRIILSNVIASQADLHAQYGGVFPEVASRKHIEMIYPVVDQAMREAFIGFDDLNCIAVTRGPGLVGSLLVGVNTAKGLALARNKSQGNALTIIEVDAPLSEDLMAGIRAIPGVLHATGITL